MSNFYRLEIKFHDGTGPWADVVDKTIGVVSKKTHAEGKLPKTLPDRFHHLAGLSFSSSVTMSLSKDSLFKGGVRFKNVKYSHPERWTTRVFWVTEEELCRILTRMEAMARLGLKYDFRGAAGCAVTGQQDPWKYFCSESIFDAVLVEWVPVRLNHKMHPDKLDEVCEQVEAILLERKVHVEGL
jgi:hypothetical protein